MLTTGISVTPIRFNPEPITVKGIKIFHPAFFRIYTDKHGKTIKFIAVAEKPVGTSIGSIFKKATQLETDKRWMGKVGNPRGILRNDPSTVRTRTRRELNLDTIREKLAYDLFQELGRGFFLVPKSRLSLQLIRDEFNKLNFLANVWVEDGITESLRIMSRYMAGYLDFAEVSTVDGTEKISFMKYLEKYHRPPEVILTPKNELVPILGLMGLLAVGRCLADVDLLGGGGFNAGFIWIYSDKGEIIRARAVKIDPGYAFCFTHEDPKEPCENVVINTHKKLGSFCYHLEDPKDIQTSTGNHKAFVHWKALTAQQQEEFLGTLLNTARYLRAEKVLDLLFFREAKFFHSADATVPRKLAEQMQCDMATWLEWQLEIYEEPLTEFKRRYPEQLLRINYIDRWGELPLPASDATFPIRELFTQLVLIEKKEGPPSARSTQTELPERDSLLEIQERMEQSSPAITLENLFDAKEKESPPRKILLLGRAGIGKSTLCQKMAHDWASGRLWPQCYQAIYWIPLRDLNAAVEKGGFLFQVQEADEFLARAMAHIAVADPTLTSCFKRQIERHRGEILILLDGFDEATPGLIQSLGPIFRHPEFILLLTSRPGVTESLPFFIDRLVENIGFSKEHISQYVHKFFHRGEASLETAKAREEKFTTALEREKNLFSVAHIPLQLQMLCTQWEQGADRVGFPSTLAGLYRQMVEHLFRWHCRKTEIDPYSISGQEKSKVLAVLGDIALRGLQSGRLIIPDHIVSSLLQNTTVSEQQLLRTGLLRASGEGVTREYCFLHLTFQEYVIAFAMAQQSPSDQKAFIVTHRCKPQFQLVIALMAGIIDFQDRTEDKRTLRQFFEHIHTSPGDLAGFYQLSLVFRCLEQCSDSIESWIEERYRVYSAWIHLLSSKQNKRMALALVDYLKGSEKHLLKIISSLAHIRAGGGLVKLIAKTSPERWQEVFEVLCPVLKDSDESVRYVAMGALESLIAKIPEERWREVFEVLRPILKDSEWIVREAATKALESLIAKIPEERWREVFEVLRPILKDSDGNVRYAAREALKSLIAKTPEERWREVFEVLRPILKDSEWIVRYAATGALKNLIVKIPGERWREVFEVLRPILKDSDGSVRKAAMEALESLIAKIPEERWREVFEVLRPILKDSDGSVQYAARETLQSLIAKVPGERWQEVFEVLRAVLKDSGWDVQYAATEALKSLMAKIPGERWQEIFEVLRPILKDSDGNVRYAAREALKNLIVKIPGERWQEVFEVLRPVLKDSDENVQYAAREALKSLIAKIPEERWREVFEVLRPILKDSGGSVRYVATGALQSLIAKIPGERWQEILEVLRPILKDSDGNVRYAATGALQSLIAKIPGERWQEVFEVLRPILKDSDERVREAATEVLQSLIAKIPEERWREVFEVLRPILKDSDESVRYVAMGALQSLIAKIPGERWQEIFEFLHPILKDSDENVQYAAREALKSLIAKIPGERWQEVFEVLRPVLKDSDENVQYAAREALKSLIAKIPGERWQEVFEVLRPILKDSGGSVRYVATGALQSLIAKIPGERWQEILEVLRPILKDSDGNVRYAATGALQSLIAKIPGERWQEIFEVLRPILKDSDGNVRYAATGALKSLIAKIPEERWQEVFEVLRPILKDSGGSVREAATEVLKSLIAKIPEERWQEVFEVLRPILKDSDVIVRYTATEVLQSLIAKIPEERWREVFEVLRPILKDSDERVREAATEVLKSLIAKIPEERWREVFEVLRPILKDSDERVREAATEVLQSLIAKIPEGRRWQEVFEVLRPILKDSEWSVREVATEALKSLIAKIPAERWREVFESLLTDFKNDFPELLLLQGLVKKIPKGREKEVLRALCSNLKQQNDPNNRQAIMAIITEISLNCLTEHLEWTPEYMNAYFNAIGNRNSPLYVNEITKNQFTLSCIEDNQEISRPISKEQLEQMKNVLLNSHILKSYVSQYIYDGSLVFKSLTQWLNRKEGGVWQVQENNGKILAKNSQLGLSAFRLIRNALEQISDERSLKKIIIFASEEELTISGNLQEIQKLLAALESV